MRARPSLEAAAKARSSTAPSTAWWSLSVRTPWLTARRARSRRPRRSSISARTRAASARWTADGAPVRSARARSSAPALEVAELDVHVGGLEAQPGRLGLVAEGVQLEPVVGQLLGQHLVVAGQALRPQQDRAGQRRPGRALVADEVLDGPLRRLARRR